VVFDLPERVRVADNQAMHKLEIRPATRDDVAAVARLFDAYRQFYGQATDLELAADFIDRRLEYFESVILLAIDGAGQAIGFCQLYPSFCSVDASAIHVLYDLYVSPASRRLGAARLLLLAAVETARRQGKSRLDLTTARTNRAAQALYESLGWVRDDVFMAYSRKA
jgi:ribosomal protein S18 acetylase RimI-like enzyme